MDGSCLDDSEIEEERAGGGPGPTGGGPEQEDRGWTGPTRLSGMLAEHLLNRVLGIQPLDP